MYSLLGRTLPLFFGRVFPPLVLPVGTWRKKEELQSEARFQTFSVPVSYKFWLQSEEQKFLKAGRRPPGEQKHPQNIRTPHAGDPDTSTAQLPFES